MIGAWEGRLSELFSAVLCTTIVHSTSTHIWAVLVLGTAGLGLVLVFVCFSYLGPVCLFCVCGIFSPVCFELSVPLQVIAWKDSSQKWSVICRLECKTQLIHSLNFWVLVTVFWLKARSHICCAGLRWAALCCPALRWAALRCVALVLVELVETEKCFY